MIDLNDIKAAEKNIETVRTHVHRTPLMSCSSIRQIVGGEVYFKCENLQKTGSFKIRGAFNKLLSLSEEERKKGVVCYSSGNHAQAVSYAASVMGVPAWVYMPETVVLSKIEATKNYGGNVVLYGKTGADAYPKALAFAKENGLVYIDPVEDNCIMAGQGTSALEILSDLPDADTIYVPVGGGGLISGIAAAVKGISPNIKVIGVEPENMNCVGASVKSGKITKIERKYSIADGLAGDAPGPKAFEAVSKYVDDMITVSDEEIEKALLLILERAKLFIEPSSAVTLAGLLAKKSFIGNKNVCLLSGGNASRKIIADILIKY